jgi:Transposase IS116/IS110/IS902 family./Transposase.
MRLGEEVDYVIGVDTHKNAHSAAVVNAVGGVVAGVEVAASDAGYRSLLRTAQVRAAGRRAWAVEGTGSFGSGLAAFLQQHGERVLEIERPRRPRQKPAKSDQLDAIRAAREALADDTLAQPRQRGSREALRILLTTREGALKARTQALCQLHALVVGAPEMLRGRLRNLPTDELVRRCLQLRRHPQQCLELQVTSQSLRQIARRAEALRAEAASCEKEIALLVSGLAPSLTAEPGVGPICAGQIICAWSHRGRVRSDAAFAALAGVAPIPASSGQVVRYRLNRRGDRQLNRALHTIVMWRTNHHAESKHYLFRRRTEGKSDREIRRCLKRHLARRIFKLLQRLDSL